ncbi:GNAT family N-acetyltransferase [Pseudomonas brassicacearum]|uniref:GNAT family N-acetyltransferase n=1 Tax=Pseudomonas brassicacearum TaxID=930166 RepID=A0A423GIV3_9PSED|nr:GNAT family N-acetyltransferase [Pseudomonas brassicacearum]ROM89622.1 GNAT family N-acetyltransferase [Pseudomonas brassicacearum]
MAAIELHRAQRDELDCIENLMQFYLYDFSEWLPLKIGAHGFFPLQPMLDYWRKPATQAFLIRVDGDIAGFVTVDDSVHFDDVQYNIGYLFVSRHYRGRGVGKFVVSALLQQLPGQWQIFHIDANQPAQAFWSKIIPELTQGQFTRHQLPVDSYPCTLFKFRFTEA